MKVPTNILGLPGVATDSAHTDTQRIMPDFVIPRPSPSSAHGLLCVTTDPNTRETRMALC